MTAEESKMEWFRQTDEYNHVRNKEDMGRRERLEYMEKAFEAGLHAGHDITCQRFMTMITNSEGEQY